MPFWSCFSCLRNTNGENIHKLDFSNCTLNEIPQEIQKFVSTLEELHLSSNHLTELTTELFACQNLRVLKLNDNELEQLNSSISALRQLQTLDLSRNVICNIPETIKSCKNLTHLDLSLNNLQRLPEAVTHLVQLQELLLNETYLEFLPANFGNLVNLRILELRSNNLITLPKSLCKLVALQRIDIGSNDFTELPEVIGQLTQLRELWIDYNRIRRIPINIANLKELIHFEANNNQLTALPNEISNWKRLEVLSLSTNDFEYLPFSIGMLIQLITLKCDCNQLKELPDSICNLENLEELIVNNNFLLRLPNTIGTLRKLQFCEIDGNLLRRLPAELCDCINLTVLSARNNKLCELPESIGKLENLIVLNLINNVIGKLPLSILNLKKLTALWIHDCQSQPLIPLQYIDNNNKNDLTCAMLPQHFQPVEVFEEQQNNFQQYNQIIDYNNESATTNSWIFLQQQPINSDSNHYVTSPSKHICFADESIVLPNNDKSMTSVLATTPRLMRSPTPYPKELRSMAKSIRQQQQEQQQNCKLIEQKNSSTTSSSVSLQKDLTSNDDPLPQDTSHKQENISIEYTTIPSDCTILMPNNQINHISPPQIYDQNNFQANIDLNNCIVGKNSNTNNNWYNQLNYDQMTLMCHQRLPITNQLYQDATASANVLNRGQPPPYHIAKAFTKKSREDLLNYDRCHQNNSDNNDGEIISKDFNLNDNHIVDELPNSHSSNNICSENKSLSLLAVNDASEEITCSKSSLTSSSSSATTTTNRTDKNSSASRWLFGCHKNPTVKQMILKKDPLLGFQIKHIQNQGIFVCGTVANSSASSLLQINDKILDVDGIDFTKIPYETAVEILNDCGPTLNIMISRR